MTVYVIRDVDDDAVVGVCSTLSRAVTRVQVEARNQEYKKLDLNPWERKEDGIFVCWVMSHAEGEFQIYPYKMDADIT